MSKFEKIKPGDILYQITYDRGERTHYPVEIVSVNKVNGTAIARWNGNRPNEVWYAEEINKLQWSPQASGRKSVDPCLIRIYNSFIPTRNLLQPRGLKDAAQSPRFQFRRRGFLLLRNPARRRSHRNSDPGPCSSLGYLPEGVLAL
jgi:hypothetical protein